MKPASVFNLNASKSRTLLEALFVVETFLLLEYPFLKGLFS